MKKLIFCFLIWAFAASSMFGQRSEIGVFTGGSFYLGDLNPSGLFSQTQFAVGGVYRLNLTTRWALRANALWGTITADDAISGTPERNLHFRSRISEFSIQAEINFLTYFTGSRHHRFSPYLFGGVGMFTFNPQARIPNPENPLDRSGRWVDLAPLRTEGQGLISSVESYNTTQIVFPFGLGFKFSLSERISVGMEWGMRKTLTDYLDDVSGFYVNPNILESDLARNMADRSLDGPQPPGSQRGSRNRTDWYSFAGITLTARIGSGPAMPCPANQERTADRTRRQFERTR
ncbi:MAG: DUF6089 family protein [Bacteroidales bacterium]|nr:DUF6089 family protein [Bacteroidales bacterium]